MSSTLASYLVLYLVIFISDVHTATVFGQEATIKEVFVTSGSTSNETNTTIIIDIPDQRECGVNGRPAHSVSPDPKKTRVKDWPWQASILRKADKFHFCGGAVITRRHVLTAAHCLPKVVASKIMVRLGEYDFTRLNDSKHKDVDVSDIRSHELYDPVTYENDIAILRLVNPVTFTSFIQPVCLPIPDAKYSNTDAAVIGWGTLFYGGPMSDVLMEVAVPVWDQKKCEDSFVEQIFETNICAAGYEGGKDSCQGDSGGPLLQEREDGRWQEIGIVSWGIRCGEKNKPGVYTKINEYLLWIGERVKDI